MRLTTMTQITLDGVTQGNGGNRDEEVERNGFRRGGWALGIEDGTTDAYIDGFYARAEAFLFGRRTFELFAGSWGGMPVERFPGWEATWRALDERPKYVASTTLVDPGWHGSTVLHGDLETAIRALKAQEGGELQVHGSSLLIQWLLARGLVDEMTMITVPVVLGQGARLFPDDGPDLALQLVEHRVDASGVTVQVFRPAGRPHYA